MKELVGELQTNQTQIPRSLRLDSSHNLPLHAMNEKVGKLIGKAVGIAKERLPNICYACESLDMAI